MIGVEGIASTSISSSNGSDEAAEGVSSSDPLGITYSSSKGTRSFDGLVEMGTTSIGFANELVIGFIFFGAEESEAADAFFSALQHALQPWSSSHLMQMEGLELKLVQEQLRNLVDFLQAQLMQLP